MHFLLQCMKVKRESGVAQSCPTLRDPMDCSLPGSSVHGIFQARVLDWGAVAFSVCAYWHLQFTRSVGLLMTAALRKGPGTVIEEINSKHNELSRRRLQQVNFPHIPLISKWPQDKMLNIPSYCRRNANLKANKKSILTCQNGHPHIYKQ